MSTALTEAEATRLASAYAAANPPERQQGQRKRNLVAAAALWLAANGPDFAALLGPLAPGVIADGWLIGSASAQVMTDGGKPALADWKPGAADAATSQVAALGLATQLQAAQASASQPAQSMASGYRTALGRALVEGATGAALVAVLKDAAHATATALNQLVQSIGAAAGEWYRQHHVEYTGWVSDPASDVCPVCAANEAQGAIPLGTPFASGDTDAPAHPGCRCSTGPAPAP